MAPEQLQESKLFDLHGCDLMHKRMVRAIGFRLRHRDAASVFLIDVEVVFRHQVPIADVDQSAARAR